MSRRSGLLVILLLVAGCSGAPGPLSSAAGSTAGNGSTAASTPTQAPTPAATPTVGPHWTLVGLGDSVAGGLKCNDPCQSYVLTYGTLASEVLSLRVVTNNLATNDGLESGTLRQRVKTDGSYRRAIADADIVTLQVGGNDWQGSCFFQGHQACLASGLKHVEPNLDGIVAEIVALRDGKPTALRVVTYYNGLLGNPQTPSIWGFSGDPTDVKTLDDDFRQALIAFNAMICRVAEARGAICVDIGPAFNGKDQDEPAPAGLINGDGAHALKAGQDLIAQTLVEADFPELHN